MSMSEGGTIIAVKWDSIEPDTADTLPGGHTGNPAATAAGGG